MEDFLFWWNVFWLIAAVVGPFVGYRAGRAWRGNGQRS
jgi:hypothetical protein